MNTAFSNNITYLRKERGISQKQASDDLGISQSLLSHYEKGIRECGLDFVVKAADYYNVTCDYLLGRVAERSTALSSPAPQTAVQTSLTSKKHILENANCKIIQNTIDFIYSLLNEIKNREVTKYSSEILMTEIYSLIRTLYKINPKNDETLFLVPTNGCHAFINSHKEYKTAKLTETVHRLSKSRKFANKPVLSYEIIMENYADIAGSVLNVIHNTEKNIRR